MHGVVDTEDLLCDYLELSGRAAEFGPIARDVAFAMAYIDSEIERLQPSSSQPVEPQPKAPSQSEEEETQPDQIFDEEAVQEIEEAVQEIEEAEGWEIEEDESKEKQ